MEPLNKSLTREMISNILLALSRDIPADQGLDAVMVVIFLVQEIIRSNQEGKLIRIILSSSPGLTEKVREWAHEQYPDLFN